MVPGLDVAERLVRRDVSFASEMAFEQLKRLLGQLGEVGECARFDFAILAEALA